MKSKRKASKERRRTAHATVRIAPFKVTGKTSNGGFTLEFIGLTAQGSRIEVELEFPLWWLAVVAGSLASVVRGKQAELAKLVEALRGDSG